MQNFADQCLDMAQAILSHNLEAINEDGTIQPIEGEHSRTDEPGHAALAIGEYFRLTNETEFGDHDLVDLVARTLTAQTFTDEEAENGLAYSALGLLSFSPAKERNPVWERLMEQTQETFDKRLLQRSDYDNHQQSFNIAKAVTRFSMGLSKKDETGKLIDRFIERINEKSSAGFMDDEPNGLGGCFDIYGILSLVFIRQALQLHANMHLRDRKLPSLRTHAEKYLRMLPDMVRLDGMGWAYGRGIGAYGQMHCISLILQALRDGWIVEQDKPKFVDLLRRLFQFFFLTYVDREHGFLVIRDDERTTGDNHTTRMANFDAARYLCQWARLARAIGGEMDPRPAPPKRVSRFVVFDKSNRKEQGLFIYHDPDSGLHVQIPLMSQGHERYTDSLAFPHCPGIIEWPVKQYLPILLPELNFGPDKIVLPAFYGKRCTIRQGMRGALTFSYEQPDLITKDEKFLSNLSGRKNDLRVRLHRAPAGGNEIHAVFDRPWHAPHSIPPRHELHPRARRPASVGCQGRLSGRLGRNAIRHRRPRLQDLLGQTPLSPGPSPRPPTHHATRPAISPHHRVRARPCDGGRMSAPCSSSVPLIRWLIRQPMLNPG